MNRSPADSLAGHYAAALDWWREAGVDMDFTETANGWLADREPVSGQVERALPPAAKAPAPPAERPRIGGPKQAWPTTYADLAAWWLAEPSLAPPGHRIAPRGVAGADLMVLVPMPEAQDSDTLLSGEQGTLIANMLRAMGVAMERASLAAALPLHLPHTDWAALHRDGLGDVILHHIALAAPRRLLVMGMDLLPLLGVEKRQGVCDLPSNDGRVQLLATFAPEYLLSSAKARAGLWRRWLEWTQ